MVKVNGTGERFNELKKYAGGIQGRSMYGDEAMLTAASSWQSRIRGVENSKRMMDLVADYAAKASGGGAVDASSMSGYAKQLMMALSGRAQTLKATVGDVSALENLSELRRKGATITEDMEIEALEKVLAPIKGAATTLANTDEGKILQLENVIGDLKEDVGRELLPVMAELASEVKKNIPTIKALFDSIGQMLKTFINTLKDNLGNISTFVQVFTDAVNLFAKAPFEITAFVGAMKLFGPALMESRTAALESTAAFRVMGRTMSGIAKGGLMALTIWAIGKIAEAAKAGKEYLGEESKRMDRDHHYANFSEAQRHVNSAIDFQKSLGLSASEIDAARAKMGSIPSSGFDMNNLRDSRAAAMFAGLNEKQIQWMKYEFDKQSWKKKANASMAAMNAVGAGGGNSEASMAEMVQKEMAERMAAKEGSKTYGILSVLLQAWYDIDYLFTVNENVFNPPPKVKSAVIKMRRNAVTDLGCDEQLFVNLVKQSFNQRRKTLRNSLRSFLTPDIIGNEVFNKRPEQLSVKEFIDLTNLIASRPC